MKGIFEDVSSSRVKGRGRLNPTVREVAARTQVSIEDFRECPNCGESMHNRFIHTDVFVDGVEFRCEWCGVMGTVFDDGSVEYDNRGGDVGTA